MNHVVAHLLRGSELAGYRIAVIGDLHIAPWQRTGFLRRAVELINRSEPHLIAIVGDFGYSVARLTGVSRRLYHAALPRIMRELEQLRAPDGVCVVLGNHDIDAGGDWVEQVLTGVRIRVLRDAHHDVIHNGACLRLIGFDDITHRRTSPPVIDAALFQGPSTAIILSHHPDFVLHCGNVPGSCPALVVSGHTHGGQIAFPWIGAPVTLSRIATRWFPAGFVPNERVSLYVTRGLGEQIPFRLLADREITLLELAHR